MKMHWHAWLICRCAVALLSAYPSAIRAQNPALPPNASARLMPPAPKAPVEYFRELLAMNPADLENALAAKPGDHQTVLRQKLAEYQALKPEERELRLRLLELRWHLLPLMRMAQDSRAARLAMVPVRDRVLIEARLKQWDQLSPELQKEFLENENTVYYFLQLQSSSPEQQETLWQSFPAERRQKMEAELAAWRALPPEKRDRMCNQFQEFFELDPRERTKTLNVLSDADRQRLEGALAAFRDLPSAERKQCIEAFRKFANLTGEERNQFLRNAERWQKMSAAERSIWRELVQRVPPMPPLPPGFNSTSPGTGLLATNSVP